MTITNPHAISRLAKHIVQRAPRGTDPAPTITAPLPDLDFAGDPDKGLLPQREAYFAQSAATRDGVVVPFRRFAR